MAERTREDLQLLQAAPLSVKVSLTQYRIRQWVYEFGDDGVYVSFSGGKDSTVLLHIVREMFPNVPAVYFDTGLEYPEIRAFVKTFDNVEFIRPKMSFRQVIEKYGYPFISKEVSERAYYAIRYVNAWKQGFADGKIPTPYGVRDLFGMREDEDSIRKLRNGELPDEVLDFILSNGPIRTQMFAETYINKQTGEKSKAFDYRRHRYLVNAPFLISNHCCDVMKKSLAKQYKKKTGRFPITAQMACESRLRALIWMQNGCNAFCVNDPISNPMSFWLEDDVLQYIRERELKICSVYGDIVETQGKYKTTGCQRTGCMFCGYGCHLEKPGEGRFERMKVTHPKQYEYIMKPWDEGGLGYKDVIDWLNENGNLHIRY